MDPFRFGWTPGREHTEAFRRQGEIFCVGHLLLQTTGMKDRGRGWRVSFREYLPFAHSFLYYDSVSRIIEFFVLAGLVALCSACGPARDGETARIHDSWNARFSYDLEKRRLVSSLGDRKRGRTWGRDELGKVDFDRYWSGRPIPSQNLLSQHKKRMDLQREERWFVAERERLANRAEVMELEATGKNEEEEKVEESVPADDDANDFVPGPFLPQGIDSESNSPENAGGIPFAPLPMEPGLPSGQEDAPPPLDLEEPPSPFAPLPPL